MYIRTYICRKSRTHQCKYVNIFVAKYDIVNIFIYIYLSQVMNSPMYVHTCICRKTRTRQCICVYIFVASHELANICVYIYLSQVTNPLYMYTYICRKTRTRQCIYIHIFVAKHDLANVYKYIFVANHELANEYIYICLSKVTNSLLYTYTHIFAVITNSPTYVFKYVCPESRMNTQSPLSHIHTLMRANTYSLAPVLSPRRYLCVSL